MSNSQQMLIRILFTSCCMQKHNFLIVINKGHIIQPYWPVRRISLGGPVAARRSMNQ